MVKAFVKFNIAKPKCVQDLFLTNFSIVFEKFTVLSDMATVVYTRSSPVTSD